MLSASRLLEVGRSSAELVHPKQLMKRFASRVNQWDTMRPNDAIPAIVVLSRRMPFAYPKRSVSVRALHHYLIPPNRIIEALLLRLEVHMFLCWPAAIWGVRAHEYNPDRTAFTVRLCDLQSYRHDS